MMGTKRPRKADGLGSPARLATSLLACLALCCWPLERAWSQAVVRQSPMPDPAVRSSGHDEALRQALAGEVRYDASGMDASPPVKAKPRLAMGKPAQKASLADLDALSAGWERLNGGQAAQALEFFEKARSSRDSLISREARLGQGYAHWRLGREDKALERFKSLVDEGFRVPEVLPNMLFLLHKKGGAKAVEPYLGLLPEEERPVWRK